MIARKIAVAVVGLACTAALAQGESELSFAVGMKLWSNVLEGGNLTNVAGVGTVTHSKSDRESGLIPFALVRYRNFGVSASTLLKTAYTTNDGLVLKNFDRREHDINFLYYFLPSASVSVGYKSVRWNDNIRIPGYTLGLAGSAPLTEHIGLYATFGVGKLKTKISGLGEFNTDYSLIEGGLSYSLPGIGSPMKATVLTAGYRQQQIRAKGIPFLGTSHSVTDNTAGPTLGLVLAF